MPDLILLCPRCHTELALTDAQLRLLSTRMLQEAKAAGLLVDGKKEKEVLGFSGTGGFVIPNPKPDAHKSLTGWWNLAEVIPKRQHIQIRDTT